MCDMLGRRFTVNLVGSNVHVHICMYIYVYVEYVEKVRPMIDGFY